MNDLLKKMARQFGYEGREALLAAELRDIATSRDFDFPKMDINKLPKDDFPKTPAEALVEAEPPVQVVNVFDPTGTAFPGIVPTPPKKAKK